MSEQVETIDADASVADARERMRGQEVRHLVVLRGGDVLGIVSERDLSRAARARVSQSGVRAAMSAPVVAAFPETTVREAANLMRGRSIGCLPVVREGELVGIVTVSDLLDLPGKNVRRAPPTAQHWEEKHRGRRRALRAPYRDPGALLAEIARAAAGSPERFACLGSVVPVTWTFSIHSREELETRVEEVLGRLVPALLGRTFHVRIHRRGLKGRISTLDEEQKLDAFVIDALETAGAPGRVRFDDPDAIVVVEFLGPQVGVSLWTREDLRRCPLLHLD